jgi:hypothetical protein
MRNEPVEPSRRPIRAGILGSLSHFKKGDSSMANKLTAAKAELKERLRYSGACAAHCVSVFKEVASTEMLVLSIHRTLITDVVEVARNHKLSLRNRRNAKALNGLAHRAAKRFVTLMIEGIAA